MYSDNSSQWEPLNFRDISLSNAEPLREKNVNQAKNFNYQQLENNNNSNSSIKQDVNRLGSDITDDLSKHNETLAAKLFADSKEEGYQQGYEIGYQKGYEVGQQEGIDAGHQEGYKIGQQEGIDRIYQQIEEQVEKEKMLAVQSILDLVANFQKAVSDLDEEILPTLKHLAVVAAQKMVGSLPDSAHQQLSVTIKELIRQFPILGKSVHLYINPNDMESAQELLSKELDKYDWHLITDPSIESGGCKVLTEKNEIDATLSSKFQVMAEVVSK